jgi:hypothetical protein
MMVEMFDRAQVQIVESSYETHRSYGYAAGYFQSLAKAMFRNMNKKQQAEFLRQVERDAEVLKSLARIAS